MYEHMNIYTYKYIHIQTYIYVSVEKNNKVFCWVVGAMGWLRSVPSIKLQVSLAEYCLFHRAILQKRPINLIDPTNQSQPTRGGLPCTMGAHCCSCRVLWGHIQPSVCLAHSHSTECVSHSHSACRVQWGHTVECLRRRRVSRDSCYGVYTERGIRVGGCVEGGRECVLCIHSVCTQSRV